jgi:hypothetical protein
MKRQKKNGKIVEGMKYDFQVEIFSIIAHR